MVHLFHPAFVHFTVAFLAGGALCEAWGILQRRPALERSGGLLVVLGTVSLLPTVVSGYVASNTVMLPQGVEPLRELHETVGLGVCALFVLAQFWKAWYRGSIPGGGRTGYAALLAAGALLVGYGAFLGGQLVYGWGVGVLVR